MLLGLVLAKRRIAIRWLSRVPPKIEEWRKDMMEWALAEEVHMKKIRKDEKAEENLVAWSNMLQEIHVRGEEVVIIEGPLGNETADGEERESSGTHDRVEGAIN